MSTVRRRLPLFPLPLVLFPGVPLPLLSYGGSSVISTLLAAGLLQSIYLQARMASALKGRVLRL